MKLESIAKIAGDFRTLWLVGATVIGALAWAGDQRYASKSEVQQAVRVMQETQVRARLKELLIKQEMGQATDYDKALIRMYEQELEMIKMEREQ